MFAGFIKPPSYAQHDGEVFAFGAPMILAPPSMGARFMSVKIRPIRPRIDADIAPGISAGCMRENAHLFAIDDETVFLPDFDRRA